MSEKTIKKLAIGGVEIPLDRSDPEAVKFVAQPLTDSQKKQAKKNIGLDMLAAGTGESSVKIDGSYEGVANAANGAGSVAMGGGAVSKSDGAHTEGILTTAGRITQADTADTTKVIDAIGSAAVEIGMPFSNQAEIQAAALRLGGFGAHAEGTNTQALGSGSHAEGSNTVAFANCAHAEGDATVAKGQVAHAEGWNTQAIGNQSHAEGASTIAEGDEGHAEGGYTKANGQRSHAEGNHTEATGRAAHAEGEYTIASGNLSHAEGGGDENGKTEASGWCSHAEGWTTKAEGQYSHSEGYHTEAKADASHAAGKYTKATAESQFVVGEHNQTMDDALFIVGNGRPPYQGSGTVFESNAFWVKRDGTTSLGRAIDSKANKIVEVDRIETPTYSDGDISFTLNSQYDQLKVIADTAMWGWSLEIDGVMVAQGYGDYGTDNFTFPEYLESNDYGWPYDPSVWAAGANVVFHSGGGYITDYGVIRMKTLDLQDVYNKIESGGGSVEAITLDEIDAICK